METKEIDGVLYELVPEEKKLSCEGCAFKGPDRTICTTLTDDCNKGLIYKKIDKPISTSNLKPFNLEAAKAGKPVCTRDGRSARIICFNRKRIHGEQNYPIVVLITEDSDTEAIYGYTENGSFIANECNDEDLMMLPERKEGWIIKPKDYQVYQHKEEAEEVCNKNYQVVAKIIWEE